MRALAMTLLGVALAQPASGAAWIEGAQEEAWLGFSVAGAGDVDGDGFGDALAGAPRDGGGAALLLRGSANGIGSLAPLRIQSDQAGALLGSFVSGAGDVNGDGVADYVLGAEAYEVGADAQGAAFVFHGAAVFAGASGRLLLEDAFAGLGTGDARAGDVNDDGFDDLVVGARFHGAGGGAFVFHGSASGVGFRTSAAADARIEAEAASAEFGASFAPAGDVNGDGFDDVVVGAPRGGPQGGGAVYVFRGGAQGVADGDATVAALALESASADAQLGASVACGDLDGDGRAEVLAGAPRRDGSSPASGAIAAFDFGSDTVMWRSGDRGFAAFGFAVAIRPRGASDLRAGWIAGAPFRSDADGEEGGALVAVPEPAASAAAFAALASAGAIGARRARPRRAHR